MPRSPDVAALRWTARTLWGDAGTVLRAARPVLDATSLAELHGPARVASPTVLEVGPSLSVEDAALQASAIGCGVEIRIPGPATGPLLLSARCPGDPDALGIRVVGPGPLDGGVRAYCEGPDCAWVSVESLDARPIDDDAFDADADAKLAVIGCTGWVSGAQNNVLTTHQRSQLLALNVSGGATGGELAPAMAFTADSRATVITQGSFSTGTGAYDEVLNLGGGNGGDATATVIGAELICNGPLQAALDFEPGFLGVATLDTAQVRLACGADLNLNTLSETARWRSYNDELVPITVPTPSGLNRAIELEFRAPSLIDLPLAVPIPAWVDGQGTDVVRVLR